MSKKSAVIRLTKNGAYQYMRILAIEQRNIESMHSNVIGPCRWLTKDQYKRLKRRIRIMRLADQEE